MCTYVQRERNFGINNFEKKNSKKNFFFLFIELPTIMNIIKECEIETFVHRKKEKAIMCGCSQEIAKTEKIKMLLIDVEYFVR